MAWYNAVLEIFLSLWEIKEIQIFVGVAVLGSVIYALIVYGMPWVKSLVRGHHHEKPALASLSRGKKESNWEVYREWVSVEEKPLWVVRIPRAIAERVMYGSIILVLMVLILWRMLRA